MTEKVLDIADARFALTLKRDERPGYSGYLVEPDRLLETARALRASLGYDYLSSVTGVDYLPDGKMEVVYHLYSMAGGKGMLLKTQVPREAAVVPSLVPVYPGAELQEREAWDLLGIRFEGHPDLRRVLLWEGFAGHPLRSPAPSPPRPFFESSRSSDGTPWPPARRGRSSPFGSRRPGRS